MAAKPVPISQDSLSREKVKGKRGRAIKMLRIRQDSNLRGETPVDFESTALTARPRMLNFDDMTTKNPIIIAAALPASSASPRVLRRAWPEALSLPLTGSVGCRY